MGGGRRLGGLLLGTLFATLVAWSPLAVQPVLAAGPLRVQAATTYTVDPRRGVVDVAIRYTVTNNKPNTATVIYYYRTLNLGVQPGARSVRASDGSGALGVSTHSHTSYTEIQLRLRANLYYHRTTSFTLRYELPGAKPRSESPIRVGQAFVTFGVWAFGDRGDGSVEVRMPAGFTTTVDGSDMTKSSGSSGTVLRASPSNPDGFFAVVTGENGAAYEEHDLSLPGGADVAILSWPEDDRWDQSVRATLETGFPELERLVGLDWPVTEQLKVRERYTPALEGYAGLFFGDDERIDVSEDIDPVTILHEASHAWFNADLFSDRWIYEGLAEEYAWQVLTATGGDAEKVPARPDATAAGAQPLNGWTFPKVIRDQATSDAEQYGYEASFWAMHQIVAATGIHAMRAAFAAADANATAYPGDGAPETVPAKDDWRRFLDLVEPIEAPDPPAIENAVRQVVTTPAEASALDHRAAARAGYRELVADSDGWTPPLYVRGAMSNWTFDDAATRIAAATAVLDLRDEALAKAAGQGLQLDTTAIEEAYEGATDSLDTANDRAGEALAALQAIAGAHDALDAPPDLVAQLGLVGETPQLTYDAARAAFDAGDMATATTNAQLASDVITSAPSRGGERLVLGSIVVVALAGFLVFVLVVRRRRRATTLGLRPGTDEFRALDARFAPGAGRGGTVTPPSEPIGASGTLGGHPEPAPSLLREATPDEEGSEPP